MALLAFSVVSQVSMAQSQRATPVEHIIIIMQENHSFDNYFGTYPTANGTVVNNVTSKLSPVDGIPNGVCLPYGNGCISPRPTVSQSPENPTEGQSVYQNDYSQGYGFPQSSGPQSMVYFDYRSIPAYWDYAEEYGLADNYFAAVLSMTTPNRLMLLTGDAPVSANYGPPPTVDFSSTIFGQLSQAGVTWGYYDIFGSATSPETIYPVNYIDGLANFRDDVRNLSSLFTELSFNSGLPEVSFVNFLGGQGLDEHPPSSPTAGELQTVSVINAVMKSDFWNSTAIFLTYDEGGGFYDHVTPPMAYSVDHNFSSPLQGLGQRVPLLVISPYSRTNYVSHTLMSHLSLLHFIEYNWNLLPLNSRVSSANLPTDFFNFSQAPRRPVLLGTDASPIAYPISVQAVSTFNGGSAWTPDRQFALVTVLVAVVAAVAVWVSLGTHHTKSTQRSTGKS